MADSQITVSTPLGQLRGKTIKGLQGDVIYSFLGVPYGKPPVGPLRFKNPEPVEKWEGVRSAEVSPPIAPALIPGPLPEPTPYPNCSEDCLYLNIYTPVPPKNGLNLPVMVWIHGGGFTFGNGNKEAVGPDFIVPQGVVLVTVNYRLGPFGFLSFQTKECSGNFGLKDQTLALRWIQSNISSFGGDPNNVTVAGESAGAGSVHFQMLSPLAKGLFQRAIAQSGCALNRWAISRHPKRSAQTLAKRLGYESDDVNGALKFLRKASMQEILVKSKNIYGEMEGLWACEGAVDVGFAPVVEPADAPGAFLTVHPKEAVASGAYADVPFIVGVNSDETAFCLPSVDFVPPYKDEKDWQLMLPKEVCADKLGQERTLAAAKRVGDFYFPNGTDQAGYVRGTSVLFFTHGIFKLVETHTKNSKKTAPHYLYVFKGGREQSSIKTVMNLQAIKGTVHADELDFLFTGVEGLAAQWPIEKGTRDHRVQTLLVKLWTDFVKTGKPSPDWPAANPKNNFSYAELEEKMTVHEKFYDADIKFWDHIYRMLSSEE